MSKLVELENLSKSYPDADGTEEHVILRDIHLSLFSGESVAITGPSGCGKSTLLNILGTLDQPTRGVYRYREKDVLKMNGKALSQFRAEEMGFIFQLHHLLPQCSVLENALLPILALSHKDKAFKDEARERAVKLLEKVGLQSRIHAKPAQLSGGERQRAAFVRALVNQPKLLLADEPTGALDEKNAAGLTDLIVSLVEELGVSLVLVTHHPAQAKRMHRHFRLQGGSLVQED